MVMRSVFAEQYVKLPVLLNPTSCSGQTHVVTGANIGLGLETARHLVRASASTVSYFTKRIA